jgi:class 3 adenylate cyclase/CRP-like cAMP-binding protein/tetratricopeptide (TPR) repeat protein
MSGEDAPEVTVCAVCGQTNPSGFRFCGHCGSPLAVTCSVCGATVPPGLRFCGNCGTPVGAPPRSPAPRSAPQVELEERKVVTVVFADLAASTELASRLDPEDLRGVLRPFFEAMVEEIERFGGTVEKFIGDAIVAVFGVPAAHEDDPIRAVRAALAMHHRLASVNDELERTSGERLAMRIGINTGEVVTATGVDRASLVTGEPVNIAARFEAMAEPGTVVVGERTYRDSRRVIDYRSLGEVTVKGIGRPLGAWAVVGERAEEPGARATPMVGRDEELDLIEVLFARALRERRPAMVTILGPAGIGKSRLSHEFAAGVERSARAVVARGRCLPYGEGLTYWPLAEILKADLGILDSDPPEAILERAVAILEPRWEGDERAAGSSRVLLSSIGVPVTPDPLAGLDPAAAKDAIARAWRFYVEARAAERPLVLLLEDLHWADGSLLDLVEHLAGRAAGPAVLVCMARPDLVERRPRWGGGLRSSVTIPLDPLSPDDGEHLLRHLLEGLPAPEEAIAQILARSEGNPFYAQELLRMLVEGGVLVRVEPKWELARPLPPELPDTVQGVIASRLDMLPPEEKRGLQDAAVVGRVFWEGAVDGVGGGTSGTILDALAERGLIYQRPSSAVAGDREFIFNHILTRDVAYASTPRARRTEAHAAVLRWSEAMTHGREEEFAELLAYHAELAGDVERTARYGMLAGHRSQRVFAAEEAIAWYDRAERAAEQLAAEGLLAEIGFARGQAFEQVGRFAEAHADYERAAGHAGAAGDRPLEARALAALAHAYWLEDRFEEGERVQAHALDVARAVDDQPLLARLLYTAGTLAFGQGRYPEALAMHREALIVAQAAGDPESEALARHGLSETLYFLGPFEEALDEGLVADRLFREHGQRPMVYHNLYMVGWLRWLLGDFEAALADETESIEGNRELHNRRDEGFALAGTTQVMLSLGRISEAVRFAETGRDIAIDIATPRLQIAARGLLLLADVELGRWDRIRAELPIVTELSVEAKTDFFRPRFSAIAAALAVHEGSFERARDLFAEGTARGRGVLLDDLFMLQVAIAAYDEAAAEADLRTAAAKLVDLASGRTPTYLSWGRYGVAAADLLAGRPADVVAAAVSIGEETSARGDRLLEWRAWRLAWKAARALGRHWEGEVFRARAGACIRNLASLMDPDLQRAPFLARPAVAEVLDGQDGLFRDLPVEALEDLIASAGERRLEAGERLFGRGEAGDELFLVDEGRVAMTVPDGQDGDRTLASLGPGEVLGEVALFDDGPRTASAVAESDARLLAFGREPILRLLERHPAVVERLIAILDDRLREGEHLAASSGPPDVAARLARAVQRLAEREGRAGSTVEILPLFVRDGGARWLRPVGEGSWHVPGASGEHPGESTAAALASAGLRAEAIHSTSWRHDRGRLVLTYVAVLEDQGTMPEGFEERPVRRAELVRGSATDAPPAVGVEAVIEHALRHLSWLRADDPSMGRTLGPEWGAVLASYQPEPFRALA